MSITYSPSAKNVTLACPSCGNKFTEDITVYEIEDNIFENQERASGRENTYEINVSTACPNCEKKNNLRITVWEYPEGGDLTAEVEPKGILSDDEACKCFKTVFR